MRFGEIKSINKTAAFNMASTFILNGIAFITAPIFTRYLGPEQFGIVSLFTTWVSVISCFVALSINSAIGSGVYHFKKDYYSFRSSILLLGLIIGGFVCLIAVMLIDPLSRILDFSRLIVLMMLLYALSNYVTSFAQSVFIYEKKPIHNFILALLLTLSTIIFSLVLVLNIEKNKRYEGRIIGMAVPHILVSVVLFIYIFHKQKCGLKIEYAKFALSIGIPTVFHLLSGLVLAQSDRLMMKYMGICGTEIGIYSAFYSFSAIMATILNALSHSWTPFYFDYIDKEDWNNTSKKCNNYIEIFTVLTCGFILLSREVGILYAGKEYLSGIDIIPILVSAIYFTFMYQFFVNYELFFKKAKFIAMGTISTALLNIFLNSIFIPNWGMYGASVATSVSYFVLFVAHYIISKNLKGNEIRLKLSIFLPGLSLVFIAIVLFYLLQDYLIIRWAMGVCLGLMEVYRLYKRRTIF